MRIHNEFRKDCEIAIEEFATLESAREGQRVNQYKVIISRPDNGTNVLPSTYRSAAIALGDARAYVDRLFQQEPRKTAPSEPEELTPADVADIERTNATRKQLKGENNATKCIDRLCLEVRSLWKDREVLATRLRVYTGPQRSEPIPALNHWVYFEKDESAPDGCCSYAEIPAVQRENYSFVFMPFPLERCPICKGENK